ncbi:MAG: hypothetical protein WA947_14430, partial [Phormidesmis sp.]
ISASGRDESADRKNSERQQQSKIDFHRTNSSIDNLRRSRRGTGKLFYLCAADVLIMWHVPDGETRQRPLV